MTPEDIARLPIRRYDGPVVLVASPQDLKQASRAILSEPVVGLDTETKPVFKKGQTHLPCLVQIAAASAVYLFQLKQIDCAAALVEVLEDSQIIKAGIGLAHDFTGLRQVFPFDPQGIVDLSLVAQKRGFKQSGVRNLAAQLLGFRVTKSSSTSNWARARLTQKQITYAATDAWVCRELFLHFQKLGYLDRRGRAKSG